ncbi:hypothetical protein LINPERHAP2_LOCUS11725, partial [Linum perenne]
PQHPSNRERRRKRVSIRVLVRRGGENQGSVNGGLRMAATVRKRIFYEVWRFAGGGGNSSAKSKMIGEEESLPSHFWKLGDQLTIIEN